MRAALAGATALIVAGALASAASADYVVANTTANSVTFYSGLPGSAPQAPTRTIAGAATRLNAPLGIALSPSGTLYVANGSGNSITVYAPGASGNAAPQRTIVGGTTALVAPWGIAVDPSGRIYVANSGANTITEYGATATGNVAPAARIVGAATQLGQPRGVALDGARRLFVVNNQVDSVTEYAAGAKGNAAPIHTLQGDATGLSAPESIWLSSFDDLVIGNGGQSSITVYEGGSFGNAPPIGTFGPIGGLTTPGGVAFPDPERLVATGTNSNAVVMASGGGTVLGSNSGSLSGLSGPTGLILRVPMALTPPPSSAPQLTVGAAYTEHSLVFGGVPPYKWSVASGALPAGLKLDSTTGLISGKPTTAGTSTVDIKVKDSATTPASATNSRTYNVNPAIQPAAYVANGANTAINAFALTSSGNVAPWITFGPSLGIDAVTAMAFDPLGHLFAANYGSGTVTEYNPGAAAGPIATRGGLSTPAGIAVGSQVVVSQQAANTVTGFTYDPATGLIGGKAFDIVGPHTGLSAPAGVVFAGGRLWVANYGNDSLTAYVPGSSGDVAPVATITGPSTGLAHPAALGLSQADNLLVANQFGPSVTSYDPGVSGTVNAPSQQTIVGPNTGLSGPDGVDVDTAGRIYVANGFTNSVQVFAVAATGDAPPVTTYGGSNTGISAPSAVAIAPPMSIVTRRLARGRVGRRYRARLRAAEGTTPYRWSLRRGRLPRGLHLSRRGVISGVPRRIGRFRFTVRVRDASHPRVTLTRRLQIKVRPRR